MGGSKGGGSKGGGGSKKKKTYTKAQQMAKARIAAGKTISSVKAANKKSMQDKARERHAKFKQTRVQTFGGTRSDSSYSKAEQARIKAAGYNVQGYAKAGDNTYGTNIKSGQVPGQGGAMSAEARAAAAEQLAAKRAEEATRQSTFDLSRLYSNAAFNQYMQAGGIRGINMSVFNNPNNYLNKGMNERIKNEQFARFGDPFSTFRKKPNPNTLFGDDALQVGKSDKNFAAGKRGNPFGRPDQAFNIFRSADKGGPGSGPTPLTREAIKRFGPTTLNLASSFLPGYNIGSKLFNEGRTGSALDKSLSNVDNVNVGGLSIGFNSPENTDIGARVGKFFTSIPGKVINAFTGDDDTKVASAGGLNIGSGDTEGSKTGRTVVSTDRDKNINYDIGGIANEAFTRYNRFPASALDALTGNKYDFDRLGKPPTTVSEQIESLKNSPIKKAILSAQTGVDANRMLNEGGPAAESLMKNYVSKIDASSARGIRNPIARLFRDTAGENQTDATAMAGRAMSAFSVDDDNFSNEPNKLTKLLKFAGVPQLSEENVQDIRHTFNKTVTEDTGIPGKGLTNIPYTQALGFANRITSGKIKDGVEESMNQLNMKNVPTLDDAISLGSQFATNMKTEGTVTKKRMDELDTLYKKYGPGGGQAPTIPSIIKGIGGPRRARGSGNNLTISGTNNMTATIPDALTPEILPLPTTVAQGGTNATNLAQLQKQAYNNQLSLYGMNPNYFANIMQPRFNRPMKRFRQVFNRSYF